MKTINKITLLLTFFTSAFAATLVASTPMLLRLNASGNSMQNQTAVYFDANGSFIYNPQYDAPSLGVNPGYLNIITRLDSIDYQIKCLPSLTQNMTVPVKVVTGVSGTYQIFGTDIQNLPSGACIFLHDNQTNTNQDLRIGSYTCNISDTESVARFELRITISLITVNSSFSNPTCTSSGNGVLIASGLSGTGPWNYYWKDSLNNIVKTSLLKNNSDTLRNVNAGLYRVDVSPNGTCANGTSTFLLHGTQSPAALFSTSSDTIALMAGVFFTNTSAHSNNYSWDFGDGMGSNNVNAAHNYASVGTYTVTLTAYGSVCGESSVYSKEIYITNQTTEIKQSNETKNIFINRDATGYYVKFNGTEKQDGIISVTDLLGRKVTNDIEAKDLVSEKIPVTITNYENQILIISVTLLTGETIYKKIIN